MYIYAENNDWKDLDENILAGDGIMGNVFLFFNDIPTLKNLKEEFNTLWIKILLKDW